MSGLPDRGKGKNAGLSLPEFWAFAPKAALEKRG